MGDKAQATGPAGHTHGGVRWDSAQRPPVDWARRNRTTWERTAWRYAADAASGSSNLHVGPRHRQIRAPGRPDNRRDHCVVPLPALVQLSAHARAPSRAAGAAPPVVKTRGAVRALGRRLAGRGPLASEPPGAMQPAGGGNALGLSAAQMASVVATYGYVVFWRAPACVAPGRAPHAADARTG